MTYERGPYYVLEAAWDRDNRWQADEFLVGLESSRSKSGLRRLADIVLRFEEFATTGHLEIPRELNFLRGDVWEVKIGTDRLPFYYGNDGDVATVRMTHGFVKRTDKTPRREIDKAEAIARIDQAK